jgi:hypothetical protein
VSYLPLKEEVDRFVKSPKAIIICIIVVLIAATGGWLLFQHYDNIERADSHDVTQTVRDTEELNRDAQTKLEDARAANQAAERANQNAQRAADSLADSNAKLSKLNESDAAAVDAAESVFRDVDAANQ